MNDIAVASGKGRRTLYTYFSRKEDVYYAVIESELERLSDKLDEVANCKMRPQDKIIELIYTHLSMIKETVVRNGNLRAEFFRNIWMVEKARKNFDEDEIEIFRRVYAEGKEDGEFDIDNIDLVADITHYCIKGLDHPTHSIANLNAAIIALQRNDTTKAEKYLQHTANEPFTWNTRACLLWKEGKEEENSQKENVEEELDEKTKSEQEAAKKIAEAMSQAQK